MIGTHGALIVLALAAPALLFDGLVSWCFAAAVAALGLVSLLFANTSSLKRSWSSCRPALPGGIVLVAIPVLQLLPWAPSGLASPIWEQTSEALQTVLGRPISLDPSLTLAGLANAIALLALAATTALAAGDRMQAAQLYRATCLSTVAMAALLVADGRLKLLEADPGALPTLVGSLCLIVAAGLGAAATRHRDRASTSRWRPRIDLALAVLTAATGLLALGRAPDPAGLITAAVGAAICLLTARLPLPPFGTRTALAITALVALPAIALVFGPGRDDVSSALIAAARLDRTIAAPAAQRMLSDTPLLGSGGGTFAALAELYGPASSDGKAPPSAAVKVYVEYGPIGLLALLASGLFLALKLIAGAARRGRDRHYSACAAAVVLVAMAQSLLDASLTGAAPQVVIALLVGIGLAQRRSADR